MSDAPVSAPVAPPIARRDSNIGNRVLAAFVGLVCLTLLLLSASLRPNPAGHGTHRQLGLPPCGMVLALGKPCPTCGMTTAFAYAAHGDLKNSFLTQPAGCIGAVCVAAALWVCLYIVLTGSRLGEQCGKLLTPRVLWLAAGVWLAAWVYKLATWQG